MSTEQATKRKTKPITAQKLYAVLRKAGHGAAKWESSGMVRGWGDWSPGVHVRRDSDTYRQWFQVTYKTSGARWAERTRNAMQSYVVPALEAAGIRGTLSDDGLIYRVDE